MRSGEEKLSDARGWIRGCLGGQWGKRVLSVDEQVVSLGFALTLLHCFYTSAYTAVGDIHWSHSLPSNHYDPLGCFSTVIFDLAYTPPRSNCRVCFLLEYTVYLVDIFTYLIALHVTITLLTIMATSVLFFFLPLLFFNLPATEAACCCSPRNACLISYWHCPY